MNICSEPGCPLPVQSGRCAAHSRQRERWRGSAASRGYDAAWRRFREWFIGALVALGIAPVCGARLPTGPAPTASRCHAEGRWVGQSSDGKGLHLDHEPPLEPWEREAAARGDRRYIDDPNRIVLLCDQCHNAKDEHRARGVS